jgi:hypothetical protein
VVACIPPGFPLEHIKDLDARLSRPCKGFGLGGSPPLVSKRVGPCLLGPPPLAAYPEMPAYLTHSALSSRGCGSHSPEGERPSLLSPCARAQAGFSPFAPVSLFLASLAPTIVPPPEPRAPRSWGARSPFVRTRGNASLLERHGTAHPPSPGLGGMRARRRATGGDGGDRRDRKKNSRRRGTREGRRFPGARKEGASEASEGRRGRTRQGNRENRPACPLPWTQACRGHGTRGAPIPKSQAIWRGPRLPGPCPRSW